MATNNDQCRITKDTSARKGDASASVRAAVEEAARKASEALCQERVILGFEQQIEETERKHAEELKQLKSTHDQSTASLQAHLAQAEESATAKERKMLSEATEKAKRDANKDVERLSSKLAATDQQLQECRETLHIAMTEISQRKEEAAKAAGEHRQEMAELRVKQKKEMAAFHKANSTGSQQIIEIRLSRPYTGTQRIMK